MIGNRSRAAASGLVLPCRINNRAALRSFKRPNAVDMVWHDAPGIFEAIEQSYPFVAYVREASALNEELFAKDSQDGDLACPVAPQQDGEYGSEAVRRKFQQTTTLVLHSPHACSAPSIAEQGEIP
jgi:hypothetical protein